MDFGFRNPLFWEGAGQVFPLMRLLTQVQPLASALRQILTYAAARSHRTFAALPLRTCGPVKY